MFLHKKNVFVKSSEDKYELLRLELNHKHLAKFENYILSSSSENGLTSRHRIHIVYIQVEINPILELHTHRN